MLKLAVVAGLAVAASLLARPAFAEDDAPFRTWQNTTPSGVRQSAGVTQSANGISVGIDINGQGQERETPRASAGGPAFGRPARWRNSKRARHFGSWYDYRHSAALRRS